MATIEPNFKKFHAIENTEYDIRAPHDGNVGCNTVEYTRALSIVLIGCIFYGMV